MKKVSGFTLTMLAVSGVLDFSGLAFGLFYAGLFFDNVAHFLTSLALVALAVELARPRSKASFGSGRRALVAGAVVGLIGGIAWELIEVLASLLLPVFIYNPPVDTVFDTVFGTLGGAVGAWRTYVYPEGAPLHRVRQ